MLIFLVYLFSFIGSSLLFIAAIIKLKLVFPLTDHNKLIAAVSLFKIKFPVQFITSNNTCIVAINKTSRKVAIGTISSTFQNKPTANLYAFDEILGCEIVENSLTLSKVTKTSLISRREIEIGEEITELTINIYINAAKVKVLSISILPDQLSLIRTEHQYTQIFTEALHLYQLLTEVVVDGDRDLRRVAQ
ncbi:MAG: hypothetical protein K6T94_08470 [Paenibacillus sp.]|nr:hypothetical protein [Paenibacillus sp.]